MGIRVQDLFDPGILRQKLDLVLRDKNQLLTKVYNRRGIDAAKTAEEYLTYGERLKPYVADTGLVLGNALDNGEVVLLEGAQATMLDVDHGTYPFVTSSSPTAGGALPTRADFKLFPRLLVHMRRPQHAIFIFHRGQWNRPRQARSGAFSRLHDFGCRSSRMR